MTYPSSFRCKVLSVRKKEGLTIAQTAARFCVGIASVVNQHAKLSRVEWKTALKSIHFEMINYRHFAGELWSDRDGYNCRNQKTTFCQQGKYQFDSTIVKVIAYHSQEAFKDGS